MIPVSAVKTLDNLSNKQGRLCVFVCSSHIFVQLFFVYVLPLLKQTLLKKIYYTNLAKRHLNSGYNKNKNLNVKYRQSIEQKK